MKRKIGDQNVLSPFLVTIMGAIVNGKVNFVNIAHVEILNAHAPYPISPERCSGAAPAVFPGSNDHQAVLARYFFMKFFLSGPIL
jgi:hypothetical protein